MQETISIRGAKQHNLKNIDLDLPKNKLVVITGLSGSGKSSLAFDTLYAEGQRRYVESLSAYARQFLNIHDKPDVESIDGLSPAIAIDQKTTSKNPRSTVGTVTEIYDYLRLLFARVGVPYSPATGLPIEAQTVTQMVDIIAALPEGTKLFLMAPIARGAKGEFRKELAGMSKRGFTRVKIDGEMYEMDELPTLDKQKKHNIFIVVDRIKVGPELGNRLADSIETALKISDGLLLVEIAELPDEGTVKKLKKALTGAKPKKGDVLTFSAKFACPVSGFTLPEIEPRIFSFNSPFGACPTCDGLGTQMYFDPALIVPDASLPLNKGAVAPWASGHAKFYQQALEAVVRHYKQSMATPWRDLPKDVQDIILNGSGEEDIKIAYFDGARTFHSHKPFEGVIGNLERRHSETESDWTREELEKFQSTAPCEACHGARLKPESLCVKVGGRNIAEVCELTIEDAVKWFGELPKRLSAKDNKIAEKIIKEIRARLGFLNNVGLDYITLKRESGTLSGGEAQRIRLASQIGSGLSGVVYVLDEPSIGLHQCDNERLLGTLEHLRALGNTVIVVEHDEDTMRRADFLVDMGPGAGIHGGEIIATGTAEDVMKNKNSITGQYLSGAKRIEVPQERRAARSHKKISIRKARANNLQNVNVDIPLGLFTCVTGVSGGGKSSLVIETLYKAVTRRLHGTKVTPGGARQDRGAGAYRQDHRDRPVAHRPHAALQSRHLYRRVPAHPRLVRRAAGVEGARLPAGALQLQRQGRPLRGVPGRRHAADRDALPAGRLRHLRPVQRRALQPRDARGEVQGQIHRRRAQHDGRGSHRLFRRACQHQGKAAGVIGGRPRLHPSRPVGDDALGRRGAAHQARQGAQQARHRQDALHIGRADDRAA